MTAIKEACISIAFVASWITAHAAFLVYIDYKPTLDYALAMLAVTIGFLLGAWAAKLLEMAIGSFREWRFERRMARYQEGRND